MVSILIRSQGIIDHNGELVGDSLLIENGKIRVIGSGLNIKASKEHNVKGFVLPAFVDAHLHLAGIGLSLSGVDLRGVESIKEMLEKQAGAAAGQPSENCAAAVFAGHIDQDLSIMLKRISRLQDGARAGYVASAKEMTTILTYLEHMQRVESQVRAEITRRYGKDVAARLQL